MSFVESANIAPPNPLTPLAFLPVDVGIEILAQRIFTTAALGAWIWDFLSSIPDDITLITENHFSTTYAVYVLSRISTIGFMFSTVIVSSQVTAVQHCETILMVSGIMFTFALPSNALLFLFRAVAVFGDMPWVRYFFCVLWLAVLGTSIVIPVDFIGYAMDLGPTKYCITKTSRQTLSIPSVFLAVYDTILYLGISLRLSLGYGIFNTTWRGRLKAFMSGEGLGHISRHLLQSGQQYFLIAVATSILSTIDILDMSIPPTVRSIFAVPGIAIMNAMATRIHRNTKLGFIKDS
ncbi:hypothetical protein C8Q75DRAFT_812218 [Abortiporus biennis]|nr:hypothetical protein C8Q75DRAFT_812218 [Abortiporus biennis]